MLEYLKEQDPAVYDELFVTNAYNVFPDEINGKIIFDLGANKGMFALLCNEHGAKEIISVEAQPEIYDGLLKTNTEKIAKIKRLNYAITDKSGDVVNLYGEDTGSSLYVPKDRKLGQAVKTISLVDLVGSHTETDMVLKLDIEGSEYDVLMEADKNFIRRFKTIYIEIHGKYHPKYIGTKVLEDKLLEFGFAQAHMLEMCDIYTKEDGSKQYVPMGFKTCKYVRVEPPTGKILIAPFAQKLRNGKVNSKNYPYWKELISLLGSENLIQLGVKGEEQLVKDVRFNLHINELKKLVEECSFFISVDSFLPHLAKYTNKKGVVIFGPSDPNIFGYPYNVNVLKNRNVLRTKQFNIWEEEVFDESKFLKANEVYKIIKDNFLFS